MLQTRVDLALRDQVGVVVVVAKAAVGDMWRLVAPMSAAISAHTAVWVAPEGTCGAANEGGLGAAGPVAATSGFTK